MTTFSRLARWLASARHLKQEYDQVQGMGTTVTLRRARALMWLGVPLHTAIAGWLSQYQAPASQPKMQAWADALAGMQAGVALGLLVFGLLAHVLLRRRAGAGLAGMAVQAAFCATYLAFGAAAAIQDVGVGNGIATFLVICMGTAVLSLMRPGFSVPVFAAAFVVFWTILRGSAVDTALLASLQIQAIAVVLIAQLISVMMWHQYTRTVLLQRKLERSNASLLIKQQELERLAERDTLTGLYNRRKFLQLAQQELDRRVRMPSDLCVLMVDLDYFKRVNDQYGHPMGDLVLQQVAARLSANIRSTDVLARIGGEEFIVLMPLTEAAGALNLAEKIRTAIGGQLLELPGGLRVAMTTSVGVTGVQADQKAPLNSLYSAADQALYNAKAQGRNQVVWGEVPAP